MTDPRFDPDWQSTADESMRRAAAIKGEVLRIGFAIARALIMHRTPEQVESLFRERMAAQ